MAVYIAFLRGINVGGHKKIKMADLRASLEKKGFSEPKTYIQSGNLIFRSSKTSIEKLEDEIARIINQDFGFEVPVIIKTIDEIKYIIEHNPFEGSSKYDPKLFCVCLLNKAPLKHDIAQLKMKDFSPEIYSIQGKAIYLYPALGLAKSKMTLTIFENKLKVKATARNWRTMHKLLELSSSL